MTTFFSRFMIVWGMLIGCAYVLHSDCVATDTAPAAPQEPATELDTGDTSASLSVERALAPDQTKAAAHSVWNFADTVEATAPAVVNISVKRWRRTHPRQDAYGQPHSIEELFRFFAVPEDLLQDDETGQHPLQAQVSLGSGFVVAGLSKTGDGAHTYYVVTNCHVVDPVLKGEGRTKITVTFDSGEEAVGELVGTDAASDIAVLRVQLDRAMTGLSWGDSDTLRRGQPVMAIGTPLGHGGTVTAGVVSHTRRNLPHANEGALSYWIQTDATINRGNSGGPLMDAQGRVVGINTAILEDRTGKTGISYAIPSNVAKVVVQALITQGCVTRSYIGVQLGERVSKELAETLGMSKVQGVLIDGVLKEQPAHKAGIKRGDVLLSINGVAVKDPQHVRFLVSILKPGSRATIHLWRPRPATRSGQTVSVQVETREACRTSAAPTSSSTKPILGISLQDVNAAQVAHLQEFLEGSDHAVLVRDISPDSVAIEDLQAGDVILQISGHPAASIAAVQKTLQDAIQRRQKTVLLLVARPVRHTNPHKGIRGYRTFHVLLKVGAIEKTS